MTSFKWREAVREDNSPPGFDQMAPLSKWWFIRQQGLGRDTKTAFIGFERNSFIASNSKLFETAADRDAKNIEDNAETQAAPSDAVKSDVGVLRPHVGDIPVLDIDAVCDDPYDPYQHRPIKLPETQNAPRVVMGIIDDAIPIAHPAFQYAKGKTRVLSLWQQDARCDGGSSEVPYGRVIRAEEIETNLSEKDVDDFYRSLDATDRNEERTDKFRFRATHGGAVADRFCGRHTHKEDLLDHHPELFPIVAVNLGSRLVEDTAGSFLDAAVTQGIFHIIAETQALINKLRANGTLGEHIGLPLVICFSFGLPGSGRMGSNPIAGYLDIAKAYWKKMYGMPFHAVLPAGNDFHARGIHVTTENPHTATLRVEPGARASTIVEIELLMDVDPKTSPDFNMRVEVTPPSSVDFSGGFDANVAPKPDSAWVLQNEEAHPARDKVYGALFFQHRPNDFFPSDTSDGMAREVATLAIQPTHTINGTEPSLPSGDWTISVCLEGALSSKEVEMRVLRNDLPSPVLQRGQKARFVDPNNQQFDDMGRLATSFQDPDSKIRRDRTINAFGSGDSCIVVGSAQGGTGSTVSPYSSAGPFENGKSVTVVSKADDSLVQRGVRTIGTRPGATQRVSGTSFAAPYVARWMACEMAQATSDTVFNAANLVALVQKSDVLVGVQPDRQGFGKFKA